MFPNTISMLSSSQCSKASKRFKDFVLEKTVSQQSIMEKKKKTRSLLCSKIYRKKNIAFILDIHSLSPLPVGMMVVYTYFGWRGGQEAGSDIWKINLRLIVRPHCYKLT